jgi:hypothetical protein
MYVWEKVVVVVKTMTMIITIIISTVNYHNLFITYHNYKQAPPTTDAIILYSTQNWVHGPQTDMFYLFLRSVLAEFDQYVHTFQSQPAAPVRVMYCHMHFPVAPILGCAGKQAFWRQDLQTCKSKFIKQSLTLQRYLSGNNLQQTSMTHVCKKLRILLW